MALLALYDDKFVIPYWVLLKYPNATIPLSIFLRVKEYPESNTFEKYLARLSRYEQSYLILMKFASQSDQTAKIVSKHTRWMLCPQKFTELATRIFLICFSHVECRKMLMGSAYLSAFLRKMAASGEDEVVTLIPSILKRSNVDQLFINMLHECDFFTTYFDNVKRKGAQVKASFLMLIDVLARKGYTNEFLIALSMAVEMFPLKNQLTTLAIALVTTLSRIPEIRDVLRNNRQIIQYYHELLKIPTQKSAAEIFLRNLGEI